jgi:hypothetical protein
MTHIPAAVSESARTRETCKAFVTDGKAGSESRRGDLVGPVCGPAQRWIGAVMSSACGSQPVADEAGTRRKH